MEKLWYCTRNFDLPWKNYCTLKKLWYCTKNFGPLIYYGKNYSTMEKNIEL